MGCDGVLSLSQPTIEKLKEQSEDGYVMTQLPFDQYRKRSGVMSKRFGIIILS